MSEPRPLYLLADSQLLFLKQDGRLMLEAALDTLPVAERQAAYLGACNGDRPEYYDLFQAAMEGLGIRACQHDLLGVPGRRARGARAGRPDRARRR